MPKRKNPDTSLEAYRSITPEMLATDWGKIIGALQKLGSAHYEKIAEYVGMEPHAVARRLSELERKGVIAKNGNKKATKSGRQANEYYFALCGETVEKKTERIMPGKTVSEYAGDILRSQGQLF